MYSKMLVGIAMGFLIASVSAEELLPPEITVLGEITKAETALKAGRADLMIDDIEKELVKWEMFGWLMTIQTSNMPQNIKDAAISYYDEASNKLSKANEYRDEALKHLKDADGFIILALAKWVLNNDGNGAMTDVASAWKSMGSACIALDNYEDYLAKANESLENLEEYWLLN